MKLIIFFFSLFSLNSFACEYLGKDGLLKTQNSILAHDLVLKLKNCTEDQVETIRATLSNLEGNISSFQLKHLVNIPEFNLNQERLIIKSLNKISKDQLALKDNIHVTAAKGTPSLVEFNSNDSLSVFCNSCLYGANQDLLINIKSVLGMVNKNNIKVDFKTYFKAYRLLSNTAAFSTISQDNIEVIHTEKIPHTELVSNVDELRFFQTNKPLKAGEILKMSDLSPLRIIKAGVKSEVILENQFIKIKTHGIPRSAGSIGQMIEVYHPEKNKKYFGKVIDINKVHVQL